MNLADNPYALKSGEAQLALDVDISLRDVLASRKGFSSAGLAGTISSQTKSPGKVENGSELNGWTNPENAKSSNNTYATQKRQWFGGNSANMVASEFGFSLPAGAIVIGIFARWEVKWAKASGGGVVEDLGAKLRIGGVSSGNRLYPTPGAWPKVEEYRSYGGSENLWGLTPSKAQVENSGFGFEAAVEAWESEPFSAEYELFVDHMEMTVYYLVEGFGSAEAEHARNWYSGTKRRLMLSIDGDVKHLTEGTITELFNGTAGTVWSFEQMEYNSGGYKDSIWMLNGTDACKKWDGTTFANWGGKPPKGTMNRVWKNRMIIAGHASYPQRLFYSEIANPELPEDETNGGYGNNWTDIRTSEDDLDPITWLEILDDVLLVFTRRSTYAIYESTEFAFQRIANVGCEGRFQSCVVDNRCYFLNRSGIYSVTAQGELRYESANIEPIFKGTGPEGFEAVDLGKIAKSARMCALPNGRVYVALTPKGSEANKWLFEAYPRLRGAVDDDTPRTPWVNHTFSKRLIKCLCTYRSKDEEVDKVVASLTDFESNNPELVYLFESTRDGLEPIDWLWRGGFRGMITEEPFERVRRLNLLIKGVLKAKLLGGTVEDEYEFSASEEELVEQEINSRGQYHALELSGESQTQTFVYRGEFALRGGKEHKG